MIEFVVIFLILSTLIVSYRLKSLDLYGSIIAMIFGVAIFYFRDALFFLVFFSFYVFASLATFFRYEVKTHKKTSQDRRSIDNVVSNGLVPVISAIGGFDFMFFGSIAAALSDTLSSEIGMLSRQKPRLITSFKTTLPGKDGAISALGTFFAIVGGVTIAILVYFFGISNIRPLLLVVILGLSGLFGSLLDSLLGATIEKRGELSNGTVNFISCLFAALVAMFLKLLLTG